MTTEVTVKAMCSEDKEVTILITDGDGDDDIIIDTILLSNGDSSTNYVYDNRLITIFEAEKK